MSQPLPKDIASFANQVSEILNQVLVDKLGIDADFTFFAGVTTPPGIFLEVLPREEKAMITKIWKLREDANSLCLHNDN